MGEIPAAFTRRQSTGLGAHGSTLAFAGTPVTTRWQRIGTRAGPLQITLCTTTPHNSPTMCFARSTFTCLVGHASCSSRVVPTVASLVSVRVQS